MYILLNLQFAYNKLSQMYLLFSNLHFLDYSMLKMQRIEPDYLICRNVYTRNPNVQHSIKMSRWIRTSGGELH